MKRGSKGKVILKKKEMRDLCRAEIPHFPQIGSDSGINCRYGSVCNRGRGLAHLLYPDISGGIYAGNGCFHFIVYRDIPVFQYQLRIDIRIGDGACINEHSAAGILDGFCFSALFIRDIQRFDLFAAMDGLKAGREAQGNVGCVLQFVFKFSDTAQLIFKMDDSYRFGKLGQIEGFFTAPSAPPTTYIFFPA